MKDDALLSLHNVNSSQQLVVGFCVTWCDGSLFPPIWFLSSPVARPWLCLGHRPRSSRTGGVDATEVVIK